MSNIVEPQITSSNQGNFVAKDSNGNIVVTKPTSTWFSDFIKKNPGFPNLGNTSSTPVICKDGTTKNQLSSPTAKYADACINNGGRAVVQQNTLDAKNQLEIARQQAQQQALLQEASQMGYSGLTDKVFGKQQGWSFERPMRLGAYIVIGAFMGRYVAKNMKKSTTLGMVVGGLAPLLAYQLSIAYDRKNMPKQEPRQKVGMNPDGSIMTEKQIANTQVSSDISKFAPQSKPKPFGNPMPLCQNGTKKVTVNCLVAPCPEMVVCA